MDSNKYIEELLMQLEEEQRNVRKEKLAVARLQREVARNKSEGTMCEKLIHDLEEERHLRLETEKRLREVTLESDHSRSQMRVFQAQFARMEETVRNLLQNQGAQGQSAGETTELIKVNQGKLSDEVESCKEPTADSEMATAEYSSGESCNTDEEEKSTLLLKRLRSLEAENSALAMENENQREQYERCLDEVANQVVQALLTQKDLREECLKLRTRVFDLEQQNRTLSVLFQQRVRLASDSLLQRLHSRIVDLSSGDLFPDVERNKSPIQSRTTEAQIQEPQQNPQSSINVLKCHSQLNLTVPSQLYPRSSCSSSELSLSSACSELSSGSFTWNDGKTCSKRSSINWEKRVSIGSSLPSNLSSPSEELPPTREKESHILEGLKRLQKRKPLLEPPNLSSKWAYKDCMNSNEGIYSLGLKYSGHSRIKDQLPFKTIDVGMCLENNKIFEYDSDSHDDVDDDCTAIITAVNEVPSKDCRSFCTKLKHSISDSLFGSDHNEKYVSGRNTHLSSREKPEKLTSFIGNMELSGKLCIGDKSPAKKLEYSSSKVDYKDVTLRLSDTEDMEVLDELQVEGNEEIDSSDFRTDLLTDKQSSISHPSLLNCKKTFLSSADKDEDHLSPCSDKKPKTFNLKKQNCQANNIVKPSLEECITVVFDAEDGQPINFNSQQTDNASVALNETSDSVPSGMPTTELEIRGLICCQKGNDARNYTVLESLECHSEQKPSEDCAINKNTVNNDSVNSDRPLLLHVPQQQKLMKPTYNAAYKTSCVSSQQTYAPQKPQFTKIPNRGKSSPQKTSKVNISDNTYLSSGPLVQEKSPLSSSPVKLSKFLKMSSTNSNQGVKSDSAIPKFSPQLLRNSKIMLKNDVGKSQASTVQGSSLLSRRQVTDHRDPPTRDKHDNSEQEDVNSPSPPPPPGRSTSLLIRPSYEHSPHVVVKTGSPIPVEITEAFLSSSLKPQGVTSTVSSCFQLAPEIQSQQFHKHVAEFDSGDSHQCQTSLQPIDSLQQPRDSSRVSQDVLNGSADKDHLKMDCSSPSPPSHGQPCSQTSVKMIKSSTCISSNQKDSPPHNTSFAKTGQLCENALASQHKPCNNLPLSSQSHTQNMNESSLQSHHSSLPISSTSAGNAISFPCPEEKSLKTRIPVGLKGLVKSPPILRKSSTIPGKNEKDSINISSKANVAQEKSKRVDASENIKHLELPEPISDPGKKGCLQDYVSVPVTLPAELEDEMKHCMSTADEKDLDGSEVKAFKRSISANNKPYLKPALGMNGAKARSQSFSNQSGEKSAVSVVDGPGKVRTQIITNTTERGNSLTRPNSNSAGEGSQLKPVSGSSATQSPSHSSKIADTGYSRQASHGSMSSSSSHPGSPSKLPCRTPPKGEVLQSSSKFEGNQSPPQKETRSLPLTDRLSDKKSKQLPQKGKNIMQTRCESQSSPNMTSVESLSKLQGPSKPDVVKGVKKQENPLKRSDVSNKVGNPAVSVAQPSIEEKVMMGIQENMQKVQGQEKSQISEIKQKTVPSIANWFGFRKSKLPTLNSKKSDTSKSKDEKKETKSGSGLGIKPTKLDKKKEKRKCEKDCEREIELKKETEKCDRKVESDFPTNCGEIIPHEVTYSRQSSLGSKHQVYKDENGVTKDQFMQELLFRVDKKAAHQMENGSNHVSCRNMPKGNSHSSAFPSNSISIQGNYKKNCKVKADTEIQNEIHKELLIDSEAEADSNPRKGYVGLWKLPDSSPGKLSNWHVLNNESQGKQKVANSPEKKNVNPGILEETSPESTCQDNLIGSSCQMRTLDSGIGTFPLPDSTNRPSGRHVPKSTSSLECELSSSPGEAPHPTNIFQKAKTLEREVPSSGEGSHPGPDTISHSASDPTMTSKGLQSFQSCIPKTSRAGFLMPKHRKRDSMDQSGTTAKFSNSHKSGFSDLAEKMKDSEQSSSSCAVSAQDRAIRMCSYSASSSDNEIEVEYGINEKGTRDKELYSKMKNNKLIGQQQRNEKDQSFISHSPVISFYQHNPYGQYGKELPYVSLLKQLHSEVNKERTVDDIPSKIKQVKEEGSESNVSKPSTISLDTLNKINSNNVCIMEEEKNCVSKPEAEKGSDRGNEETSLNSPEKAGVDNLESLSDSLYDSFSSCASQGSNEV
ncbi:nck-associated protein 5 [Callorhinchus milii]|uniref:nck-associated protein 5 n=1 Tax=Callorhinchus milii TaxID=7868 RepID=UPI001C3F68BA|nr:nck-associated protein 5 [Callorhinchus milii]